MNVKELIEKYEYLNHNYFRRVDTSEVLRDLKQLDEPQKVTVPQFVADVIEGVRIESAELEDALLSAWNNRNMDFVEWYNKKSNRDLFARAWLDGYEVEKEMRYLVKMKGISGYGRYLNKVSSSKKYCFALILV